MRASRAPADSSLQVRSHVQRVALAAALLALVLYLVASFVVDLVVADRLTGAIDSRLATRLRQVVPTLPPGGPTGTIGAGLGLAIAEAVLRDTGGTYMVDRAPLGGARFAVSWPRHRPHDGWPIAHGTGHQA